MRKTYQSCARQCKRCNAVKGELTSSQTDQFVSLYSCYKLYERTLICVLCEYKLYERTFEKIIQIQTEIRRSQKLL